MNGGGARFSVSVSPAGMNGWSGFRENAAQRVLRAQNAVFRSFFYVFYALRPVVPPPRVPGASMMTKPWSRRSLQSFVTSCYTRRMTHARRQNASIRVTMLKMPCVLLLRRSFPFVLHAWVGRRKTAICAVSHETTVFGKQKQAQNFA